MTQVIQSFTLIWISHEKVADATSPITSGEKLKVFYANDNVHTTPGAATIMSSIVRDAGGIPYADTIKLGGDPTSEHIEIPYEDIIKWNPDVIISANTNVTSQVKSDAKLKDVSAIKNNKIYTIPMYERTDGITSILGLMWTAQTLYPDKIKFDISKEARDFYKLFYRVNDLTDEQIAKPNA